MYNSFLLLLSLFLVIAAGAFSRKINILPEEASKYFNKFIFYFSAPAIVFLSITTIDTSELMSYLPFLGVNIFIIFIGYIFVFLIMKLTSVDPVRKGVLIYTGNGGNVIYFGFPILLGLFGTEHFNLGVLYGTVVITFGDLMGFYLLGVNKGNKGIDLKGVTLDFVKNPIVFATFLAVIAVVLGIIIPKTITDSLETLGRTITGLALFSLGVYLYGKLNLENLKLNLISCFFKLIALPSIAFVTAYFVFGMRGVAAETSVIMAAMPTAVFSLIVAEAYDLDRKLTSNTIVMSSILFLITINMWTWVIQLFV